jgi:DNA-binding MarR family transcriptional regulator
MAQAPGSDGDGSMIIPNKSEIPREIVKGSVVLQLAAAYFAIGKRLEQKTQCSQTRGFIMSTLRGGAALNQNQIAKLLAFDRTVVHRAIKTMIRDGLLSEEKAESGRGLLVQLTAKGNSYRESLIKQRRMADEKLQEKLKPREVATLLRLLEEVARLEF